jgi:transcriptional regulator with XRE-family HTH domain
VRLGRVDAKQREIARTCKVSQSSVSQWRSGQKKPLYENRLALFSAFGIPMDAWDRAPVPISPPVPFTAAAPPPHPFSACA